MQARQQFAILCQLERERLGGRECGGIEYSGKGAAILFLRLLLGNNFFAAHSQHLNVESLANCNASVKRIAFPLPPPPPLFPACRHYQQSHNHWEKSMKHSWRACCTWPSSKWLKACSRHKELNTLAGAHYIQSI